MFKVLRYTWAVPKFPSARSPSATFLKNEIKVFDSYYKDFEDKIPLSVDLIFNVNDLKTEKEVLQWYVDMNAGGTPHTTEEIDRVKEMMKKL